ncbi:MAG: YvcK family protein [Candidatus Eremiobacteraeota bacterium]|nr:YvcK family protein [Candidatus Eremiobacteraeota bacterium]
MNAPRKRLMPILRWFYPGLGVKRWLLVAIIGLLLLVNAINRYLVANGAHFHANELFDGFVADYFSPAYLSWIFGIIGLVLIFFGIRQWLSAIIRASATGGQNRIVDTLIEMRLQQGYKIVAIGGGTGLSTLLRGLKRKTANLTAVVTVSDDGGSSGRLKKELGVLPPGDVRNCLVALADDEAMVTDLFRYRFHEGEGLIGHSFGNLFLAAMTGITGNFDKAIKESSRVLNIKGRVLPSTLGVVSLCAKLADGTIVEGESHISKSRQRIDSVYFNPPFAQPLNEVLAAIREADAIVLGPGSLFTSILPNFLVDRISYEVAASTAIKMYVCNVMTQPGETDSLTAGEHVEALLRNAGERVCDYVIVNDQPPSKLLEAYAEEGQVPVVPDIPHIEALKMTPVVAQVISETINVRHDSQRLAEVVIGVIDRAIAQRASFMKPAPAQPRGERFNSPA